MTLLGPRKSKNHDSLQIQPNCHLDSCEEPCLNMRTHLVLGHDTGDGLAKKRTTHYETHNTFNLQMSNTSSCL